MAGPAIPGVIIAGFVAWCLFIFFMVCFCWYGKAERQQRRALAIAKIQAALTKEKLHPPFYSYSELRDATEEFSSKNNLGHGAYGAVYKGKLADGTLLAVKKLFQDRLVLSEFLNEALLIMGIKHKNLVQLKGCCVEEDQRILVYEYAENGNLAEALWGKDGKFLIYSYPMSNCPTLKVQAGEPNHVKKAKHQNKVPLSWQQRLKICMGIASGLSYLHEGLHPRIIHRDIKPANILMDGAFNAKIADFGLARAFLQEESLADYSHVAGTFGYLAPEYVTHGELSEKADVFSFGVVLLEIVSGRKCVDQSLPPDKVSLINWVDNLRKQGSLLDVLDSSISPCSNDREVLQVLDIAYACVRLNPTQRPTMLQVVSRLQGNSTDAVFEHPSSPNSPSMFVQKIFRLGGGSGASLVWSSSVPVSSAQEISSVPETSDQEEIHLFVGQDDQK